MSVGDWFLILLAVVCGVIIYDFLRGIAMRVYTAKTGLEWK